MSSSIICRCAGLQNRAFHSAGVVDGLEISRHGNREISISPGFAVDREGRELVIQEAVVHDLRRHESHQQFLVLLGYKEVLERQAHRDDGVDAPAGAKQGSNRVAEIAEISLTPNLEGAGTVVQLGTVHLDANGDISNITHHNREIAAVVIPHSSIHAKHLVNGAVTVEKLSQEVIDAFRAAEIAILDESITFEKLSHDLRAKFGSGGHGWVRLPFRPQNLRRRRVLGAIIADRDQTDFNLDVEFAHCDLRGARGTMGIPVPGGGPPHPRVPHRRQYEKGSERASVAYWLERPGAKRGSHGHF